MARAVCRASLERMKRVYVSALACLLAASCGIAPESGSEDGGRIFGCQDPGGPCTKCYPDRPGYPDTDMEEWDRATFAKYCEQVPLSEASNF